MNNDLLKAIEHVTPLFHAYHRQVQYGNLDAQKEIIAEMKAAVPVLGMALGLKFEKQEIKHDTI